MNNVLKELVKFGFLDEALIKKQEEASPPKVDDSVGQNTKVAYKQVEKGFKPEDGKKDAEDPGATDNDSGDLDDENPSADKDGGVETVKVPKEMLGKVKSFIAMAKELEDLLPKDDSEEDKSSEEEPKDAEATDAETVADGEKPKDDKPKDDKEEK